MRVINTKVLLNFVIVSLAVQHQTLPYGSASDIDGNVYLTVAIGAYEWMAENLRVSTYNDGTKIPWIAESDDWQAAETGAYCWFNNDEIYAPVYGALYNWYAVNTDMLCPVGWKIPSDMEWNELEAYVDSRFVEGDPEWYSSSLLRGYDAAEKLKAVKGWRSGGNGDDSHGFHALPGGERRVSDGSFFQLGGAGFWWSSTEAGSSEAWFRSMAYFFPQVARNTHDRGFGFSVRCLRMLNTAQVTGIAQSTVRKRTITERPNSCNLLIF